MEEIKTLLIFNDLDNVDLLFSVVKGDITHLHDVKINTEHQPELELEAVNLIYDSNGEYRFTLTKNVDELESKEWDKICVITWIP